VPASIDGVSGFSAAFSASIARSQSGVSEKAGGVSEALDGRLLSVSNARNQSGVSEEVKVSSTTFPESLNAAPSSEPIECSQSGVSPVSGVAGWLSNGNDCEGCCDFREASVARSQSVNSSFSSGCEAGWLIPDSQDGTSGSGSGWTKSFLPPNSTQRTSGDSVCDFLGFGVSPVIFASQSGASSSSSSVWERSPANRSPPEKVGGGACGGICGVCATSSSEVCRAELRASLNHCGRTGSRSAVIFFVGSCPGVSGISSPLRFPVNGCRRA